MNDVSSDLTTRIHRRQHSRRGVFTTALALISFVVSAWTLYEMSLRQPHLTPYASGNWRYGRGAATNDEILIVPLTVENHGARSGAILDIELVLTGPAGRERRFASTGLMQNEKDQQLFAPMAVAGRSAHSASVIFAAKTASGDSAQQEALIGGPGAYTARLTFCATYDRAFGLVDEWLTARPGDLVAELSLAEFNIARLLAGRREDVVAKVRGAPAGRRGQTDCGY